jgi:hypothetical protein
LSGSIERRGRFVEHRVIGLEDVGHPGGDVECNLNVGDGSLPGEADGVVEENLMRSDLDDQAGVPTACAKLDDQAAKRRSGESRNWRS